MWEKKDETLWEGMSEEGKNRRCQQTFHDPQGEPLNYLLHCVGAEGMLGREEWRVRKGKEIGRIRRGNGKIQGL